MYFKLDFGGGDSHISPETQGDYVFLRYSNGKLKRNKMKIRKLRHIWKGGVLKIDNDWGLLIFL